MRTTTKLQQSKSFKSEANRSDQGIMTVAQQRQEKRNEGGTTKDDSTICKSEQITYNNKPNSSKVERSTTSLD